jgi:folate-dependent phosphoribosylglycinamide formyltransferase PurN
MEKIRIGIITDDDPVWLIPFWCKVIDIHKKRLEIVSVVSVPSRLAGMKSIRTGLWSLSTFGFFPTLILTAYSVKIHMLNWKDIRRFRRFQPTLKLNKLDTNSILHFWSKKKFDMVFITTSRIIPTELLQRSNKIFLNKHASLLPKYRGIFPFIWAGAAGDTQGFSVHIVTDEIDGGKVVFQQNLGDFETMVDFYHKVYEILACEFLNIIMQNKVKMTGIKSSDSKNEYYSLPNNLIVHQMKSRGLRIIKIKDLR